MPTTCNKLDFDRPDIYTRAPREWSHSCVCIQYYTRIRCVVLYTPMSEITAILMDFLMMKFWKVLVVFGMMESSDNCKRKKSFAHLIVDVLFVSYVFIDGVEATSQPPFPESMFLRQ